MGLEICRTAHTNTLCILSQLMGVSESKGTFFWGPYNKDPTIQGTISGAPIFGNPHLSAGSRPLSGGRNSLPFRAQLEVGGEAGCGGGLGFRVHYIILHCMILYYILSYAAVRQF